MKLLPQYGLRTLLRITTVVGIGVFLWRALSPGDESPIVTETLSRHYNLDASTAKWHIEATATVPANDKRFTGLKQADARTAPLLSQQGIVLGTYVESTPFSRRQLFWLIENGCPNANLHVEAEILLMDERYDQYGHWFQLVSIDDYWTATHHRDIYDFAIYVHNDGTIRLMNPWYFDSVWQ